MLYRSRLEQYRRRRSRSAARRHGAPMLRTPGCCRGKDGSTRVVPLGLRASEGGFEHSLWDLACRVSAYPGIRGMLYRSVRDGVIAWVVAPRPMTIPLRLLAATWAEEFAVLSPALHWSVHISDAAPPDAASFRCLFWRTT